MPRERLITHHKRKVLRKRIPLAETLFGAVFIVLVGVATAWVLAQGDNFDPADRDISFELLQEQSVDAELYTPPVKPWVEPGAGSPLAGLPELESLPAGLLDSGWKLDGRVETYDESNVYEKINGAAEQYRSFGFVTLTYVTLLKGSEFINIEIYDQGEFKNALGIFSAQRAPGRRVLRQGEIYYYETPAGVIGGYRNLYFKIVGSSDADAIRAKAASLLELMSDLPAEPSAPPRAFTILTRDLGVDFDDLEYRRSDVFQYEFLSDFWFGAVEPGSESRWFIHQAADTGTARSLFEQLRAEQEYEYRIDGGGDGRVVMQHEFLETWFALDVRGSTLFGVEGAATRKDAEEALERLEEALGAGR